MTPPPGEGGDGGTEPDRPTPPGKKSPFETDAQFGRNAGLAGPPTRGPSPRPATVWVGVVGATVVLCGAGAVFGHFAGPPDPAPTVTTTAMTTTTHMETETETETQIVTETETVNAGSPVLSSVECPRKGDSVEAHVDIKPGGHKTSVTFDIGSHTRTKDVAGDATSAQATVPFEGEKKTRECKVTASNKKGNDTVTVPVTQQENSDD